MKLSSTLRAALVALMAFTGFAFSSAAHADSGFVKLTIYKAGWIIGGSGGGGVLTFRGRSQRSATLTAAAGAKHAQVRLGRCSLRSVDSNSNTLPAENQFGNDTCSESSP